MQAAIYGSLFKFSCLDLETVAAATTEGRE